MGAAAIGYHVSRPIHSLQRSRPLGWRQGAGWASFGGSWECSERKPGHHMVVRSKQAGKWGEGKEHKTLMKSQNRLMERRRKLVG